MITIELDVNGRMRSGTVEPRTHLADFLRETLNLTGTHLGCEHGVCGACTLMVDGRPVRSCLMLAAGCHGATIRTIEGFDDDPLMVRLRQAFSAHHGLQCGYCTPGMLVTAYDIVRRLPTAGTRRIREELSGNLCRCTGYMGIVAAIADVLDREPPPATVQPLQRMSAPRVASGGDVPSIRVDSQPDASTLPLLSNSQIEGGTRLERHLALSASADSIWRVLQDVDRVAACLPGARIDERQDNTLSGAVAVAIGPMKASFRGRALVTYVDDARAGSVAGSGRDPITRSVAEGALEFRVVANGASASMVSVALTYRLKGPLVQFGRPALVATVVDQMLAVFTRNLIAATRGEEPTEGIPIDGIRFLRQAFATWIGRILRRQ